MTEEKAKRGRKPKELTQPADDSGLIAVQKAGETLQVHPTALADHKRQGWKVI